MWELLDAEARERLGKGGVRQALVDGKRELASRAARIGNAPLESDVRAVVSRVDGEPFDLVLEEGRFRVRGAGALPSSGTTPKQALSELRWALAVRANAFLFSLFVADAKRDVEAEVRALRSDLERLDALYVRVDGARAQVALPSGRLVRLLREGERWRIDAIE